jgi:hypothetical protein
MSLLAAILTFAASELVIWLFSVSFPVSGLTSISRSPLIMAVVSVSFGILTLVALLYERNWGIEKYMIALGAIVGIGFGLFFLYIFSNLFEGILVERNPFERILRFQSQAMTGTAIIAKTGWKRNFDLDYNLTVIETVCIIEDASKESIYYQLVDIFQNTTIYEKDETGKHKANINAIQLGQVVEIEYVTLYSTFDSEIYDFLATKYDPASFDTPLAIGALQIVIQKGETILPAAYDQHLKFRATQCEKGYPQP